MAFGIEVSITALPGGNLQRQVNVVGNVFDHMMKVIEQSLESVGAHAAERAQANAPIKDGDLRASISHKVVKQRDIISVFIIAAENYAIRMHEELTPAGRLQLGPRSRAQPGTPEGGVGGKYIERVLNYHLAAYRDAIGDNIQRSLPFTIRGKIDVRPIRGRS